jgi:hypothetical protein
MLADKYPSQHLVQLAQDLEFKTSNRFISSAKIFSKNSSTLIQVYLPVLLHGFRYNDGFYTAYCGKL